MQQSQDELQNKIKHEFVEAEVFAMVGNRIIMNYMKFYVAVSRFKHVAHRRLRQ